ncbi:MAG: ComF family protein [Opitutales bacterium]
MLKETYAKLLDFLFPRHCIGCGALNPKSSYSYICEDCAKSIYEKNGTRCLSCGEFVYLKDNLKSCAKCYGTKFYFSGNFCPVVYRGINASLVKELKYRRAFYLLDDIAKIFIDYPNFQNYLKDSILVPVPLHKNRQKKRRFNQSIEIAKAIAKHTKTPIIPDLLIKLKDTQTQTHLDTDMRKENIRNAFVLNEKYASLPRNSKLIIVDDVMTTGATLNECARTLRNHKFTNIRSMNFTKRSLI